MKKIAIFLPVLSMAASNVSYAETTIFGQLNQIVSKVDGINYHESDNADAIRIHDNGDTVLGVSGSEKLGNGLTAVFQVEFAIALNGGEGDMTSATGGSVTDDHALEINNTFVGIEGGFGAVTIGRMDTPAYLALDEVAGLMVGGAHQADDTIGIGFLSSQTMNNMINYVTPDFGGVNFSLATIAGEEADTGEDNVADGIAEGISAALTYNRGPIYGTFGYTGISKDLAEAADDTSIFGLGLKYTTGSWGIGYMYEKTESEANGGTELTVSDLDKAGIAGTDANEYESHLLIGSYEFGRNRVSLKYGMGEFNDAVSTERQVWGLGVEHSFSERTQFFIAYSAANDENSNISYDSSIFSLGISHSF